MTQKLVTPVETKDWLTNILGKTAIAFRRIGEDHLMIRFSDGVELSLRVDPSSRNGDFSLEITVTSPTTKAG
jgi:hypothetical protein